MFASAKNYDVIFFQMRTYMPHLEPSIKRELNRLLAESCSILSAGKKIKPLLDNILPKIFNFRVKAIHWLAKQAEFDFSDAINQAYPQLEELKLNPKLEGLAENILFSLRCNQRVINELISPGGYTEEKFVADVTKLPIITYDQFLATLAYGIPDYETAQKIVDWVNASLYIEFIILSAVLIHENKAKASEKTINELSFLIANAAQEYSAVAVELGILPSRSPNLPAHPGELNKQFLKEQKYLADLGLSDLENL